MLHGFIKNCVNILTLNDMRKKCLHLYLKRKFSRYFKQLQKKFTVI